MTLLKTIMAVVPKTVAEDLEYYADESGLYTDAGEMATESVRLMLIDVTAGFTDELDNIYVEYMAVRENGLDSARITIRMTESMAADLERLIPTTGYDLDKFAGMALMRRINEVAMYFDDRSERFGTDKERNNKS